MVPRGFVRVLGKLAELSDSGIQIYFFTGNHDLWMKDYLEKEIGATVFRNRQHFVINQKKFFIAHGDGLGPGDKGYKRMKKLFTNKVAQFFFYLLHPDFAVWLGINTSRKNKLISGAEDVKFLGEENEWLVQYVKRKLETEHHDYFLFGHRHLPMEIPIGNSVYMNLGDWVNYFTYAVFDGNQLTLERNISEYIDVNSSNFFSEIKPGHDRQKSPDDYFFQGNIRFVLNKSCAEYTYRKP